MDDATTSHQGAISTIIAFFEQGIDFTPCNRENAKTIFMHTGQQRAPKESQGAKVCENHNELYCFFKYH